MSDTTVPTVPTQEVALTLAQQARVNLLLLSIAFRSARLTARLSGLITEKASREAGAGLVRLQLESLNRVAHARFDGDLPPFGGFPPARPFSYRTQSVEIDESAEALLARGNMAFQLSDYEHAFEYYVAALEAAERA